MKRYVHKKLIPAFTFIKVPPPPTRQDIEQALQPSIWRLDKIFWQQNYTSEDYHKSTIVEKIDTNIRKDNLFISYNALGSPKYSPRRYPYLDPAPRTLLLTTAESRHKQGRYLLSNIPKTLRPVLRPPLNHKTIDGDLSHAHLTIAAIISKDLHLKDWLKKNPHQDTGDLFAPNITNPLIRRKLGKRLNSAITMGATAQTVLKLSKDEAHLFHITEKEAFFKINSWWAKFPLFADFRKKHADYIRYLKSNGQGYKLTYGRTLVNYDKHILQDHAPFTDDPKWIYRSSWSALITAYEAAIMDHIFVAAWKSGLKMGCPMYDGAMWHLPEGNNLKKFKKNVQTILDQWDFGSGFTLRVLK